VSEDKEFTAHVREATLRAFDLKPWDAGLAPVPLRVRIWRKLTFAYRRGKAVDWSGYNPAEAEARAADEAYRAALPGRMRAVADLLGEGLPDGLRFELQVPAAGDCEAVAADMDIDPAVPMTKEQHAEFTRRMDERLARRFLEET
jgi:hypothetical protein